MSSQLATGVWHPSYLLKPNLQAKDSCGRKRESEAVLLVSDTAVNPPTHPHNPPSMQSLEAQPVGDVFLAVPSYELKQVGGGVTRQFVCVSIDQGGKKNPQEKRKK